VLLLKATCSPLKNNTMNITSFLLFPNTPLTTIKEFQFLMPMSWPNPWRKRMQDHFLKN
jgi:hypothetical protein